MAEFESKNVARYPIRGYTSNARRKSICFPCVVPPFLSKEAVGSREMAPVNDGYTSSKIQKALVSCNDAGALVFQAHSQIVGGEIEILMSKTISAGSYLVRILTSDGKNATGQVVVVK